MSLHVKGKTLRLLVMLVVPRGVSPAISDCSAHFAQYHAHSHPQHLAGRDQQLALDGLTPPSPGVSKRWRLMT